MLKKENGREIKVADFRFKFSVLGFIIFMIPMIINIVYMIFPPVNAADDTSNVNRAWEIIEHSTRILYAIAICVIVSDQKLNDKSIWLYLGLLFLVLYYIAWIRYFIGGRDAALLAKSFFFVPMPLAVFPVLYFLFAAIWLHNYVAAVFMLIFGIAHNVVSYASLHQ